MAKIIPAIAHDFQRKIHIGKDHVHGKVPNRTHNKTDQDIYKYQTGKILPGFIFFLFSHFFHDNSAATGSQHGRNSSDQRNNRGSEINS